MNFSTIPADYIYLALAVAAGILLATLIKKIVKAFTKIAIAIVAIGLIVTAFPTATQAFSSIDVGDFQSNKAINVLESYGQEFYINNIEGIQNVSYTKTDTGTTLHIHYEDRTLDCPMPDHIINATLEYFEENNIDITMPMLD